MELKDIKELVALIEKSECTELKFRKGDEEIVIRKRKEAPAFAGYAPMGFAPAAGHAAPAAPAAAQVAAAHGGELVKAPIVGTFYRSSSPDAEPFVTEGKRVKKGDVLCILEAMKVMNQFEAEFDCEVVQVLAENGKAVEYGAPLFEVKRA